LHNPQVDPMYQLWISWQKAFSYCVHTV